MLKFHEDLTESQQKLYDNLSSQIYEENFDIEPIIQPDDLLNVFKAVKNTKPEDQEGIRMLLTILGGIIFYIQLIPKPEFKLASILKVAQDKGILKDVISINTILVLEKQHEDKKTPGITEEGYTLTDFLIKSNYKSILNRLEMVKKSCGLESFWKVISEDDRERIKTKLNEDEHKHKDVLDEINRIEGIIRTESEEVQTDNTADDNLSETSSLASDESTINSKSNSATDTVPQSNPIKPMCKATLDMGNESESRKDAAKKGMKFGAIGGAITALAVGLGLYFGTGAALTVLPTIIGIALVAALLVGATIGAITYDILKPKSCVDTVRVFKEFDTIKQEANTAAM